MNRNQAIALYRVLRALHDKSLHRKVNDTMLLDDLDTLVMLVRQKLPADTPKLPSHHDSSQIHDWLTWEWDGTRTP